MTELITLGAWTEDSINALLRESASITSPGLRIQHLSEAFLNTPYQESTLIGDNVTPEVFVINLSHVDCFTFLDYVEAMRRSADLPSFVMNLRRVRYQEGEITFARRNHFFTDWIHYNASFIEDATASVAPGHGRKVIKELNNRGDGQFYLRGIAVRNCESCFIPSPEIDSRTVSHLQSGDYIGIYSESPGLDVSHVGIFVRDKHAVSLRHASRTHGKVIDEDFGRYIHGKPGIIVLRARQ